MEVSFSFSFFGKRVQRGRVLRPGSVFGRRQQNDTRGGGEDSRPVVGTGALCWAACTRAQHQGRPQPRFLTGGWRRPFSPSLTQYEVAQQEAGTSLFCFVAFACSLARWLADTPRVGGGGGAGAAGLQRAPRRALEPSPPDPPLAHLRRAPGLGPKTPRGAKVCWCGVRGRARTPGGWFTRCPGPHILGPPTLCHSWSSARCTSLPGLSFLLSARSPGIEGRGSLPEFSGAVTAGTALQQSQLSLLERTPSQLLRTLGLQHLLNWG